MIHLINKTNTKEETYLPLISLKFIHYRLFLFFFFILSIDQWRYWLEKKKNLPMQEMQEIQVRSLGQEDPWRKAQQPTPVCLPGESHGQRTLWAYSLWGHTGSDTTEVS